MHVSFRLVGRARRGALGTAGKVPALQLLQIVNNELTPANCMSDLQNALVLVVMPKGSPRISLQMNDVRLPRF